MTIMILAISLTANIILVLLAKTFWDGWNDDNKRHRATIRNLKHKCEALEDELRLMEDDMR